MSTTLHRSIHLLSFFSLLTTHSNGAAAATDMHKAKWHNVQRSKGVAKLVQQHVANVDGNACDVLQIDDVSATMIATFSSVDYTIVDSNGNKMPKQYLPGYAALFLLTHNCHYGSTQSGAGMDPMKSSIWRVTYEATQPLPQYPRDWPAMSASNLKFEFVQSMNLAIELFPH